MTFIMLLRAIVFGLCALASGQEPPDLAIGKTVFESQCAVCHGVKGGGGRGPSLNRTKLDKAPDDEALGKLISQGSDPEMPGAWQLSDREVASVAAFVRSLSQVPVEPLSGNADRGARVYEEKGCASCHIIAGRGTGFGPELTTIGMRRNAAHLRESLVTPGAFVADDYATAEALTTSGERMRGIRANEDSFTIQLKDNAGRFRSFRKDELQSFRISRQESLMPSYEHLLTPEQLDDLVAYLAGLGVGR